ncbi:PAS domain-containing protein [Methylomonas methanica]|uniref:histidine kinase n=1 Tax=Methylomonas methanica (strain DSM 25384 / MC09) TaxID=857087 RepID=F9ZVU3_METMM|nr:PAS domain-containing protein [Methylomonas methanica]AEF99571.1 PAS sensor protein [Methylomonas methanica MC09]
MNWKPLFAFPVRLLVPLLFALVALLAIGVNYQLQVRQYTEAIRFSEQKRLREHLGIEQGRLEREWGVGNILQVRRLVSSLPLLGGITHAWLVDNAGNVVAALSRTDIGQPLAKVLAKQSPGLRNTIGKENSVWHPEIHIHAIEGEQAFLGEVGVQPDLFLLVRLDLRSALSEQLALGCRHLVYQAGLIVLLTILLGCLLHVLWFRRAAHLTAVAIAMGKGDFELRTEMEGRDELATIGAALDSLAVNQQRYQAELRQLVSKLETIANASPVLFWTSRPDKGGKWFNRRWLEYTGRSMEQEQGAGWLESIHPGDIDNFWAAYVGAFELHQSFSVEYRLRHNDGNYRWVLNQGMPRYDADGYFMGYIGSCLDISEQKQLNERLAANETHYRNLFDHNPAPMLIFARADLQLLSVNHAFEEHYGYSLEEALSLKLPDIYPESEQAAVIGLATQDHGYGSSGEWHHRKRSGEFMDVEVHSNSLIYADQACKVMVAVDITERKRAEIILQQRNEELERFNIASTDRELAMIDLKRRVNALSEKLGLPQPYDLSFAKEISISPEAGQSDDFR